MGNGTKKNVNKNITDPLYKERQESVSDSGICQSGMGGTVLYEGVPIYNDAFGEIVYSGQNNTYIVLGRDRKSHEGSGYGGLGDTAAGSIDIVVGRKGKDNEYVNPNFKTDAARIYVSQKTDVDTNFDLATATNFSTSESAIGIKADAVRVVGRRSVKVVAGEGEDLQNYGVDIIANNDDTDMQPLVKGDNMALAIQQLVEEVSNLIGIVQAFGKAQDDWNSIIATLTQNSPFYGALTIPMQHHFEQGMDCIFKHAEDFHTGLAKQMVNLQQFKDTYINPESSLFINSRNNKVN